MIDEHLDLISDTLEMLANRIHEETGEEMLIGWGVLDGEATIEGCVTSDGMKYPTACALLAGITYNAVKQYGEAE